MTATRFSRQREAILEALRARCDHPTAEALYHALRQAHPNISLGTVYRNLALLQGQGEVRRLCGRDGPDRYDGDTAAHDHLHCRTCGAVVDIVGAVATVDLGAAMEAARRRGMVVEGYQIGFDGLCGSCAASGMN